MSPIKKIILFCFVLRLIAISFSNLPKPDSAQARWYRIAINFADGNGFSYCEKNYFPFCSEDNNSTGICSPVPIIVYSFFIKYFHKFHTEAIYIFQMALGILSIYYFYLLGVGFYDSKNLAAFGALVWGTYFPAISLERYLMGEPLACYLLIIGLYYLFHAYKENKIISWVTSAVLIGLAALSRSPLVYFPFLLFPVIVIQSRHNYKLILNYSIFLFLFIIVLSPWAFENKKNFGVYKFGTTLNGYNLYRFNYFIKFDDYYNRPWQSTTEFSNEFNNFLKTNDFLIGNENEHEMDKKYLNEGLTQIKKFPLRYLHISLHRFINLFSDYKLTENRNVLWPIFGIYTFLLFILSIISLYYNKLSALDCILYILVFYFILGHSLVASLFRYIVPIVPFIILLSLNLIKYLNRIKSMPYFPIEDIKIK